MYDELSVAVDGANQSAVLFGNPKTGQCQHQAIGVNAVKSLRPIERQEYQFAIFFRTKLIQPIVWLQKVHELCHSQSESRSIPFTL